MKTKLLALGLAIVLALGMISCGNGANQPNATTQATTQATTPPIEETNETTAAQTEPPIPPVSYKTEIDLSNGFPFFMVEEATGSDTEAVVKSEEDTDYLSLRDNTEKGRANVALKFEAVKDIITVSYRVRFTALSTYTLNLIPDATNPSKTIAQLVARPSGKLCVFNGTTETELCAYTENEWIEVSVCTDFEASSFTVTLNGEEYGAFAFRNDASEAACYVWNTLQMETGGMDVANITVDPFIAPPNPNIPTVNVNGIQKKPLVISDEVKDGLNYLSFPTVALTEDEVWISYKRGYGHTSDFSNLDVTVLDRATNQVITTHTVDSSEDVRFQNPEFVTMPNGEIFLYVDVQKKGVATRLGIYTYRFHMDGSDFSKRTSTSLIDDKGIEYGYVFDSVIDGNTLYMLAMTFPELQNQGHGRSVHLLKTENNGQSFTHVASMTELLGVSVNESALHLENGIFTILCRGDDGHSYFLHVNTAGEMLKSVDLTLTYNGISYMGRPSVFEENGSYFFMGRNIPTADNKSQELAMFEFDFETLNITSKRILDTRTGSAGDAYYAESFVSEINGQKFFCVANYGTSFSAKPSIELFTIPYDNLFKN